MVLNTGYQKRELDLATSANSLFKIHRSSVTFKNIVITSHYDSITATFYTFHPVELREKSLNLIDVELNTEGTVLVAETMFYWKMERVTIDAYRNVQIFYVFIECNGATEFIPSEYNFKHLTVFSSQERPSEIRVLTMPVIISTPADMIIDHLYHDSYIGYSLTSVTSWFLRNPREN